MDGFDWLWMTLMMGFVDPQPQPRRRCVHPGTVSGT